MAEAPADDLRSLLSDSFDQAMSSTSISDGVVETPKPKAEPVDDVTPPADKTSGERARKADGKFAKKDAVEEADPKAKEPEAKEDKVEPKADDKADDKVDDKTADPDKDKAEPKAADDPKEKAISRWSSSDKAMFKLQSPEAQDFLLRKVNALDSEYTKKTMAIADLKASYEPVQQLFAPHLDVLKQKGLTPAGVIQRWADVENRLVKGEGAQIIAGIVQGYNIDKAQIAKALGLTGATTEPAADPQQQQSLDGLPPALAAELQQLRAAVQSIESAHKTTEQRALEAQRTTAAQREAEAETTISSFKTATATNGDLLHPFFDEVESDMIALAQSYKASGRPIPQLPELYETAVYANPSTRAALLASQQAAQEAKRNEEARAKAASARRAASSITGAPGSGQAARSVRSELSLREQLEEAAADQD